MTTQAPLFNLTDLHGKNHTLEAYSGKTIVLEWVNYQCPFVLKFYESGVMPKLQAHYREQGVIWLAVYSAQPNEPRFYSATEALRLNAQYGAQHTAYLLDTDGDVAQRYGAQTTPHMCVIRPDGCIAYDGAVDSAPSHFQHHLAQAEKHLEIALDAVLAGQPVPLNTTRAYGSLVNLLATQKLQAEMDATSKAGGGRISLPAGRHVLGAINLRSHIELHLPEGCVVQGSDNWTDYGEGRWEDALVTGKDIHHAAIEGPGIIDTVNTYNVERMSGPQSQQRGRRGAHIICLQDAAHINLRNLTLAHAGNYGITAKDSHNVVLEKVKLQGGYDGLNTERCRNVQILHCDFRTGDDAVAGLDNQDFLFEDTSFNSSCNGIRFSGQDVTFRRCRFWGPGEYPHRGGHKIFIDPDSSISGDRTNMLAAISHFAPQEPHIAAHIPSDNWLIEDVKMERVESIYQYDHGNAWQFAQPVKGISFIRVTACDVGRDPTLARCPVCNKAECDCADRQDGNRLIFVSGAPERPVRLRMEEVSISPCQGLTGPLVEIRNFERLEMAHTRLLGIAKDEPVLMAAQGGEVLLDAGSCDPAERERYQLDDIENISIT